MCENPLMPSVLAIISRAIFEKMVPRTIAVGDVVETDRYVSSQPAFTKLAPGDAIFLVTVRPPDERLWLVAVLEDVKRKKDAWVGAANRQPIRDITSSIQKLELSTGGGIQAKKGALGMSLQTPRLLTANDVALLRGGGAVNRNEATPAAQKPKAAKQGAIELPPQAVKALKSLNAKSKGKRAQVAARIALEAVGFPNGHQEIPLAEELTPAQRAVAEKLAPCEHFDVSGFAMPRKSWSRQRWLGLAPGGMLERTVELRGAKMPLWRAITIVDGDRLCKELGWPLADRLEALAEAGLGAYDCHLQFPLSDDLDGSAGAWGKRTADLMVKADPRGRFSNWLTMASMLAVVRAGQKLEPKWDLLVPLEPEILRALPEARRRARLAHTFTQTANAADVVQELAGEFPADVEAVLAEHAPKPEPPAARPVELALLRAWTPKKIGDLSASQQKQLVEMGRTYDQEKLSAAERLASDDGKSLVIREIADAKGKHVYDAFSWLADDGCVFAKGTTQIVAEMVQHTVQCKDKSLQAGLQRAIESRPKKKKK
jgi:hypothetical protein